MKTRTGFVSNSSSSSFIIYGIEVSKTEALEMSLKSDPVRFMSKLDDVIPQALEEFLSQNSDYAEEVEAMDGEFAITAENFATAFDGEFLEYLAEEGREYDLWYRIPFGGEISYQSDDEDESGVVGIHIGGVEYGVEYQFSIDDLVKADEKLKAAGITETAAVYSVHTGY